MLLHRSGTLPTAFRAPSYSTHQPLLSYEQFHKQLKTYLFDISFPLVPHPWTGFLDFGFCTVKGPFLFLGFRMGFGFIVLGVVLDDSSTLIVMLLLLLMAGNVHW